MKLIGVYPPIEKMDGPLHQLLNCEKFSLSTNMISTITNLQSFKNLKVTIILIGIWLFMIIMYLSILDFVIGQKCNQEFSGH